MDAKYGNAFILLDGWQVEQYGRKWKKIGLELDRSSEACRDKYRELHIDASMKSGNGCM